MEGIPMRYSVSKGEKLRDLAQYYDINPYTNRTHQKAK